MATQKTTSPRDYLGHPSELAEAFKRFDEAVARARKVAALEPRAIAREIGIALNRISGRIGHSHDATRALSFREDDQEATAAVLEMSSEYQCETSNQFFAFAGVVLVALEQANMVRKEEVTHG